MEQSLRNGWLDSPHVAVRTGTSLLVTASAGLYLTVVVKGILSLGAPPTQMVSTMAEGRPEGTAPGLETSTLLAPLAVAGALIAALLLIWSGMRGLRDRGDQRAWRRHQSLPLIAYTVGAISFGLAHLSLSGDASIWAGANPLIPGALLGLIVTAVTLLLPAQDEDAQRA